VTLTPANCPSDAEFSPCGRHRYNLWRTWNAKLPILGWIMLNPADGNRDQDDATIRRCRRFAADLGFGGIVIANVFSWISKDPTVLRTVPDPIGPDNDEHLIRVMRAPVTIAAWGGSHPAATNAFRSFAARHPHAVRELQALKITSKGHPGRPGRLPRASRPRPWRP